MNAVSACSLPISQFVLAIIDHSPDIYLDEIQDELQEQHGIVVSISTIWRTLKRLGITSKKVCHQLGRLPISSWGFLQLLQLSKAAQERCEIARREFVMEIGDEPVERIVCGDEAAVNILTSYRENGWARQGVRAQKRTRFVRGTRYVYCLASLL